MLTVAITKFQTAKFQFWISVLLVILFTVGLWGHHHTLVADFFVGFSEPFLFAVSLLVLFGTAFVQKNTLNLDTNYSNNLKDLKEQENQLNMPSHLNPFWLWLATGVILTFIIEVIGVKTGAIFGVYQYGQTFDWKILDVPVVIGLNWVMVSLGAIILWQKQLPAKSPALLLPTLVGLTAVLFDWFLETVAVRLNYWTWQDGSVPLQNYIAWFWIAFWLCIFYQTLNLKIKSYLPVVFLLVQTLWFAILKFTLAYTPNLEYWLVICLVLVFTTALSFHPRSDIKPHLKPAFLAISISAIPFLVWDVVATARGHWQFNPKFIEGFYIFNLPIEEVWFFIAVPYSCLYVWSVVRGFESWPKLMEKLLSKN